MRKLAKLLLVVGAAICLAQSASAQPNLDRWVVGSGAVAAVGTTGGGQQIGVVGTIGQTIIGVATNSQSAGYLGFWYAVRIPLGVEVPGDLTGSAVALRSAPNPFTDWTEIRVTLPTNGKVSLKLYDALGRPVRTLIDGDREAGDYVYRLGAEGLESGHYTAELTAAGTRRTITMVVIK